jgi:hypothetical protein
VRVKSASVLLASALATSIPAVAEIVRCTDAHGAVTYQQVACPEASRLERTSIPTQFPEPNLLERDRLFAREAALDRRLEARRDRELREAQMREARAEREAESERLAMKLAAQAAQPQYLIVYPMPVSRKYPLRGLGPGPSPQWRRPG